jgi:hypothetical protein
MTENMISGPELASVGFTTSAAGILRQAQTAIAELLFGAGLEGARSTDIGRALGLDKNLAWKVSRFAREADPLSAARHMPGVGGMKILLEAAAASGAPAERIESVRRADAEFRQFVEERAGDLRTFEAMVTGSRRDAKAEFEQRRTYYQSGAAIWGVRASAQFLMLALCPSKHAGGMLDVVQASGFVRLERLRPETPWIVRRLRTTTDDGHQQLSFERVPLDPEGVTARGALPLLREFCSDPPPQIRQYIGSDGITYDELSPGLVGPGGAVTVITGEFYRAALPSVRSADNRCGCYKLVVRTPVEHVLLDVLVHKELTHFGPMTITTEGLLEGRPPATDPAQRHIWADGAEPAKRLGSGPVLKTARLPIYESVARRALALAGQNADDFIGYRAALDYPAAPSEIMLSCEIGGEEAK